MGKIGCHLAYKEGFMGMALQTTALHTNTFQFFTRNQHGERARAMESAAIHTYMNYAEENEIGPVIGYAPFSDNPASSNEKTAEETRASMTQDIERMEVIPGQIYLVHPGSATHDDQHKGLENAAAAVNDVLTPEQTTKLCLVNSAGSGSQVASSFEDMAYLLDSIKLQDHVGACLDISNAWGAGYDVKNDLDGVLDEYDKTIGLDRMIMVHLSDPKHELGGHHSHHEQLGDGELGIMVLREIYRHPKLADKIFILETPHADLVSYEKALKALLQDA